MGLIVFPYIFCLFVGFGNGFLISWFFLRPSYLVICSSTVHICLCSIHFLKGYFVLGWAPGVNGGWWMDALGPVCAHDLWIIGFSEDIMRQTHRAVHDG